MGAGKDYDKSKNLCFLFEQCHASFSILVVNIGIVVMNCIRSANYFSMIVAIQFRFIVNGKLVTNTLISIGLIYKILTCKLENIYRYG